MSMPLPRFEYRRARSVEEAISIFLSYDGRAVYLAGGTDLVPRMKQRLSKPMAVIDLKGIDELYGVSETEEGISIGSLETIFDLRENSLIRKTHPAFYESLSKTSCETLQMRGTIGGNLLQDTRCIYYNQSEFWRRSKGFCFKMGGDRCNAVKGGKKCFAVYMSDNAPSLLSIGARVTLEGPEGERTISLEEIFSGRAKKPFSIKPGEILKRVIVPRSSSKGGYEKLRVRGSIDYPLLGLAFSVIDSVGRFVVGAMGPRPMCYELSGDPGEVLSKAYQEAVPVSNTVLSPAYRRKMIKVMGEGLVKRVLEG